MIISPYFKCTKDWKMLSDKFDYKHTSDFNYGIISNIQINKGDIIRFSGKFVNQQSLYTLQVQEGLLYLEDPIFMGKILHSCDPNLNCNMNLYQFIALRDIQPEEFLTMDYETTEEDLFQKFQCKCGSTNCRGEIRGYKYR